MAQPGTTSGVELRRFRAAIESAVESVCRLDAEERFVAVDRAFATMIGRAPEALHGRTWQLFVQPEDHGQMTQALEQMARHSRAEAEVRVARPDGAVTCLHLVLIAIRGPDGRAAGCYCFAKDVTEYRRTEEALRESQRALQTLLGNLPGMAYRCAPGDDWAMVFVSEGAVELTGYRPEQLVAHREVAYVRLVQPEDLPRVRREIDAALAARRPYRLVYRITTAFGDERWVSEQGRGVFGPDGALCAREGFVADATEQREAEAARLRLARHAALRTDVGAALAAAGTTRAMLQRCAEAMVRHLDAAFARIWTHDAEHDVLVLQASAGAYTNLDGAHARVPVGRFKIGRIAQRRRPILSNDLRNDPEVSDPEWARREGMVAFAGLPLLAGDKLVGVMALFARSPLELDVIDAQASVAVAIAQGIERRTAEEQFLRLACIVESSDDAIIATTVEGVIVSWNAAAQAVFGYAAEEAVGRPISMLVPPDRADEAAELMEGIRRGERARHHETIRMNKRGERVEVSLTISPIRSAAGAVQGASVIARDISEQKRLQARLLLADRMASVGTLAAGVAHEINNPLGYMLLNLESAARRLAAELHDASLAAASGARAAALAEVATMVDVARQGADRIRVIVHDLTAFSRAEQRGSGPVDVRQMLEMSLSIATNEIRHRARLVRDYADVPMVEANEARLGQVFLNLLLNAAQAIPEGYASENEIRVVTRTDAGGRVVVEVRDTGSGIPAEHLGRIFDPFFTTRPVGVGTGLGLSMCHAIVTAMGGDITVDSEAGRGSTFRVILPAMPVAAAEVAPAPPAAAGRRARILVVDDEPMILTSLQATLGGDHDVAVAISGHAALERIHRGERFDVILCDLMMPQMSGMDVYARIAAVAPDQAARMVFLTGGAFTLAAQSFLDEVPNARLEKPFGVGDMMAVIRDLVAGPPEATVAAAEHVRGTRTPLPPRHA